MQILTCSKNGLWWQHGSEEEQSPISLQAFARVHMEDEGLLKLAAIQRMNTDSRRAVFCVIMSADDYVCPQPSTPRPIMNAVVCQLTVESRGNRMHLRLRKGIRL
jgi:hypothetical protein